MHDECFSSRGWSVVKKVAPIAKKHAAVLAGGTALALHIGHRKSVDLDFFTLKTFSVDKVIFDLSRLGLSLKMLDKGELYVIASIDGVKFSLFTYPYPFVSDITEHRGLSVAGIVDIASMKVVAVSQRGTKRDFIDLYCILQRIPMPAIMLNMVKRYGKESINAIHIGKALVYFADADSDYEPEYLKGQKLSWDRVKSYFRKNVKSLVFSLTA
ncbi:MAG: hypothetical protein A2077_00575 [Nitrospirae bacterium GWC2_46_6]|nr:MAG: hypothetical protein A2Z82_01670 [Nitrospirae bacterium GWA2_46_11]OGW22716.1 MAG: hypothetical protein A2077_00575 [Nitrospirae bacterium GWC2_46_6]OGW25666.1 MAG: hypothetical protein A2X55_05245 [Nitrospirae bacterium GWB2_47_37]HAK87896.1 hypothetical protein [Nitrospiraceae bacterium]HCZ11598.1 hypothetical protein [Nitrospiraceae bacterium]